MKKRHDFLGLCLVAALFLAACAPNSGGDAESGGAPAAVPEVSVTNVVVADISRMLTVPGIVAAAPNQDVKISPLVGGRVAELTVAEGDRVTEGQVVARLEEGPLRDALHRAEAAVAQGHASLENARLSLARNQDLLNRGIAARKDLEDSRTAQQVAEASVQQAEADVSLAQLQLQRARVQSPLSGIVVKRFVNVGEQVDGTAGQPLIEVANLAEVELNAGVPPEELNRLRAGQAIGFSTTLFPGTTFSGRIVAISAAVDPANNTAQVRIRVANPGGSLRLGMNLTAQIQIETHAKALVVPPQAIYRDPDGNPRVYRLQQTHATSVPVELGIETTEWVELTAGVSAGDTVILDGGYGLEDEATVSILPGTDTETK
jgi:cobalt-zinc-cadmium efflux system membrane fusion protein